MVPSGTAVALYVGDAVIRGTTADADGTCPTVTVAVMGDAAQIFGVITSFEPDVTDSTKVYRSASTNRYCNVCVDPDVIFEIQDDGAAVIGIAGVGLNANLIQTHAGSTVSGVSQMELKADTVAANASFQLLILNAAPLPNNDATIARAVWQVLISQHQLRTFVTTFGLLGS
jgi:proteasome assembly chaperone (PAC2) family protein